MDFRIFYISLYIIAASYAEQCLVANETPCIYTVTCTNNVDNNMEWTRFRRPYGQDMANDPSCEKSVSFGGYNLYPVQLVFKQTHTDTTVPVPITINNSWRGQGQFLNIIHSLDLSENNYETTPVIKSMQNLVILNVSRNHLTIATLSNRNDLTLLTEIDLSYNTISDIQMNIYEYPYNKLIKMDISHNYLVKIPDAIFDTLKDLQILDLSYNYIDTLGQFTFEGIKTLSELNLSNNRLTDINSALFRFSELKVLNLSGNRIKDLKQNDFKQLVKLESLDLSSNIINTINVNVFDTMTVLDRLYLSNNVLEVLNKNTFSNVQSLTSIDLSTNKIRSLPKGLFKNTTILIFSITENKLEGSLDKGMFEGVNVTKLDLSNQFLTDIKDYSFNELIRLDTLLLHTNSIKSLSNMCFKTLVNLEQLDLSNNEINNLDFDKGDLINLQSLLLTNNRLTVIKHEQLQHLNNLEYLDVSGNQISKLESSSFHSLRNLINLEINNNPLVGTLETGTFDGLVLLPSLDISRNKLTMIQNASFNDMSELKELNMSLCDIGELQYNVFIHTGYIETLDLSFNKLQNFFINTTELISLSKLLLNNNLIKSISSFSLNGLSRLNKIILSHNVIENINNESFSSLVDLRHLDLSYNQKLHLNVSILEKNKQLFTLILSGIQTTINFAHIAEDSAVSDLFTSNANIRNISELDLNKLKHLDYLDLSYNNITKLKIGDFTGISNLRSLDLSFNKISSIQPGVFKDNSLLDSLNISHNYLSSISYGIFRGLNYLSILDVSYNNIKDLQSERFYEVKSLTKLIADFNKIDSINAEEFAGTSLAELSIGDNPLPCQVLIKLKKNGVPFEITAIKMDEHSNENVNGVACNKHSSTESTNKFDKIGDTDILNGLRNILFNLTNYNLGHNNDNIKYLENISNILDKSNSVNNEKLTNLVNLTSKVINLNNNTNIILNKIVKALNYTLTATNTVTVSATPVTSIETVSLATTYKPITENGLNVNQSADVISYINKVRKELENTITIEKHNIINEIESKFSFTNYRTESLPTSIGHEKLVSSNNEDSRSLFTETCVALILLILVGLVLYKFYKSRMFIRNRFSYSTRELPGAMENSTL